MKVLVTGANGFLGQHVVQALRRTGGEVVAAVRAGRGGVFAGADGIEVREADLRVDALPELLDGIDVVVHLAAQVTGSDEARFGSTAVGTEKLLAALPGSGVSRLVLVSSYSVYDWEAAGDVMDESTPVTTRPYDGRDGYTVAKVWQERLVREYAETSGADVVILRPGFIWGRTKEDLAGAGIRLGPLLLVMGPRMRLPLTYVSNCADAIAAAVVTPAAAGQTFNVVDGPGVSAWRYSGFLARLDRTVQGRVPIPYAAGRALVAVLALVMPRVYRAGGKLPGVLVPASYAARFRPVRHTAEHARRVLDWTPRVDFEAAETMSLSANGSAIGSAIGSANGSASGWESTQPVAGR